MSELNVYHHELRPNEYAEFYLKYEADKVIAELEESHKKEVEQLLMEIAELKERSQWHKQKDKDIYFECGKHWGAEYIIKMKDGTTHFAYGGCDEGGDGSVSTYLHFQDDDYEWEYDDIDIWYEIPDPTVIGNIKECNNGLRRHQAWPSCRNQEA